MRGRCEIKELIGLKGAQEAGEFRMTPRTSGDRRRAMRSMRRSADSTTRGSDNRRLRSGVSSG
jgi:hypothetical protein